MKIKEEHKKKVRKFLIENTVIISIFLILVALFLSYYLVFIYPVNQVSQLGITNVTEKANFINQYRITSIQLMTTFAQIFGGIAVFVGLYFAWGNLTTAREGQITERFTRAVDQLGSEKLQIRLGGIYALERIANESDKDYWPIMEILTTYIRDKSPFNKAETQYKVCSDIQAILYVIGRRKNSFQYGESKNLELQRSNLLKAHLERFHLEGVNFYKSNLQGARLQGAHLEFADLRACFIEADLSDAHLERANLEKANLEKATFIRTNLIGARNLKVEQLSKAKTLYKAELNPELEAELKAKGFGYLFENELER